MFLFLYNLFLKNKAGTFLVNFSISIRLKYYLFEMRKFQSLLVDEDQEMRYLKIREKFLGKYKTFKKFGDEKFTTSVWKTYEEELEKVLLPYPKFSFLQDASIIRGMVATGRGKWLEAVLKPIEKKFTFPVLKKILREDCIGQPLLCNEKYLTSHNTIEHIRHLSNYSKFSKNNIYKFETIIDWGGGYGSMAKLFWRLLDNKKMTYVIVDLPIVCCLQWLYLSVIFGEDQINLLQNPKDKLILGKINIVPVFWASSINISVDLFISTWALSESSKASQDLVFEKNWFNAKHLLLAYRESDERLPDSDRIGKIAKKQGANIIKVNYLKGKHFYAFR